MQNESGDLNDPFTRHVPLLELLEIKAVSSGDGEAAFEMVVDERHLRTLGLMHGGVTSTLLDTALGFAAVTKAPNDYIVVTVQLSINYIRPAWKSEKLLATGQVQHSGRKTAVACGEIRTADGMLVATGTGTFMFLPKSDAEKS